MPNFKGDKELERIWHQLRILPVKIQIGEGDLESIYSQEEKCK